MCCRTTALMRIICALLFSATFCCSFLLQSAHAPRHKLSGSGSGCCGARWGIKLQRQRILTQFSHQPDDNDVCPPILPCPVLRPRVRYGPQRHSEAEFAALQRRVRVLESLVGNICGAVVYSDDISLLERNTAEIGQVYRDASFGEARQPVFARQRIQQVLQSYGFSTSTSPHTWIRVGNSSREKNCTNTSRFA